MLVGDPSAGKSPALDAVLDAVKDIESSLSNEYVSAQKEWKAKAELAAVALSQWKSEAKKAFADGTDAPFKPNSADAGSPPIRERIRTSDPTTEAVADLMATSWRGLLLFRDELSGWLSSMDRYNSGGDRPFWLEAYGGRPYTVDRKASPEPIIVDHLSVSVLGGTQPDKLESLLVHADDDGLLARFLIVFPDPVPLSRPHAEIDNKRLQIALEKLRKIPAKSDDHGNPHTVTIPFSDAAADVFQDFRKECRIWEGEATGLLRGHVGKLPGLALRVACVLAHLDWADEEEAGFPDRIEVNHVGRACHFVGEHCRQHAFRAYGNLKPPEEIRNARRIAEIISQKRPDRLTIRNIQRLDLAGMQTAKLIEAAFKVLEQADWVRRDTESTAGRPRVFYVVNPKLWEEL
jgi:putative DNA primase/helicase